MSSVTQPAHFHQSQSATTTTSTMIFPQSLFLVCILTLIRSSVSNHVGPDYAPVPDGQNSAPEPAAIAQSGSSTDTTDNHISTRRNPTSHRGAGDPCGPYSTDSEYPAYQTDFETTINTCGPINTTFTHAPSIYGVQCLHANPSWNQWIDITSFPSNVQDLCSKIAGGHAPASQWTWSSGVCTYSLLSLYPIGVPYSPRQAPRNKGLTRVF